MILEYILISLLIISLFVLFYQDVKSREVSWILFPATFVLSGLVSSYNTAFIELVITWVLNLLILGSLFLCLLLYVNVRFGRTKANFWSYFGLGDVLFFIVLSVSFSAFNFVLMIISSLLFSLVLSILIPSKKKTVPLAGFQALFLIVVIFLLRIFDFNPFNENWIYLWL